jgi:peptide/nickel transport system permease protein
MTNIFQSSAAHEVTQRGQVRRAITTTPSGLLGLGVLLLVTLAAVGAPVFAPTALREQTCAPFEHPSWGHVLGCDDGGIDMLTLVLWGARVSLVVGFAATLVAGVIGGTVGILAGYCGGWLDAVLMRITDYLLVIPVIPLMVVIAATWGSQLSTIILIIGTLFWAPTARVLRAEVASVRERAYVRRALGLGAGHVRVVWKHVLPQVFPLLVASLVPAIGFAIFFESALAFLGLGDPNATSWGKLIANGFYRGAADVDAWWAIVPPGVCIALVTLGSMFVGRAVEEAINPRLRTAHVGLRRFRFESLSDQRPDSQ